VARQRKVAKVGRGHLLLEAVGCELEGRAHDSGVAEEEVQVAVARFERRSALPHARLAAQVQLAARADGGA
jgi:hypothetical protein